MSNTLGGDLASMPEKRVRFTSSDARYGYKSVDFETSRLPDVDHDFISAEDLNAFERALQAPDPLHSPLEDGSGSIGLRSSSSVNLTKSSSHADDDDASAVAAAAGAASGDLEPASPALGTFVTAQSDWAPVSAKPYTGRRKPKKRKTPRKSPVEGLLGTRTRDETREGYLYQLSKWPLLLFVFTWLGGLAMMYLWTRWYIWVYEYFFTWRGERETLRRNMRQTSEYKDWVVAAKELDAYLGRKVWREENGFAYYDSKTVKRVWEQMRKTRATAEKDERDNGSDGAGKAVDELRALIEACVKNDFVGVENPRLYSQTYYGTKNLVQNFLDECEFAGKPQVIRVW